MEEEENGLNRSSHALVRDSTLAAGPASNSNSNEQPGFPNRVRHVYL
jgi:hypothetical protein